MPKRKRDEEAAEQIELDGSGQSMTNATLSDSDFRQLQQLGKVAFNTRQRAQINEWLRVAGTWNFEEDARATIKSFDESIRNLESLQKSQKAFFSDLIEVEASDMPTSVRTLIEIWRANLKFKNNLPTECYELRPIVHAGLQSLGDEISSLLAELKARKIKFQDFRKRGTKRAKSGAPRSGRRRKNEHIEVFIYFIAPIFQEAGGRVSAARSRKHEKNIIDTPFVRALEFLCGHWPEDRRPASYDALGAIVRRVLKETDGAWKRRKNGPKSPQ